jgi:hypothetical protein
MFPVKGLLMKYFFRHVDNMGSGRLVWNDLDMGSGISSNHFSRQVAWTTVEELQRVCDEWVTNEAACPVVWNPGELEEQPSMNGEALVGRDDNSLALYFVIEDKDEGSSHLFPKMSD